jgi:hypothetical protein
MTAQVKVKHPDAVFGADTPDALSVFVEALRTTDTNAVPPTQRVTLADGVALAAQRLVAEYDRLTKLKEEVDAKAATTATTLADIEAREKAVTAREALAGLHAPRADSAKLRDASKKPGILLRLWRLLRADEHHRPVLAGAAQAKRKEAHD